MRIEGKYIDKRRIKGREKLEIKGNGEFIGRYVLENGSLEIIGEVDKTENLKIDIVFYGTGTVVPGLRIKGRQGKGEHKLVKIELNEENRFYLEARGVRDTKKLIEKALLS